MPGSDRLKGKSHLRFLTLAPLVSALQPAEPRVSAFAHALGIQYYVGHHWMEAGRLADLLPAGSTVIVAI